MKCREIRPYQLLMVSQLKVYDGGRQGAASEEEEVNEFEDLL